MKGPIETHYNGYRFRSRLEARWAVFLSVLGVKYEYEHEGYVLSNGDWYLPDFWLPELDCFVEIKPTDIEYGCNEWEKAKTLSADTRKCVIVCCGTPGIHKVTEPYLEHNYGGVSEWNRRLLGQYYFPSSHKVYTFGGNAWDMWKSQVGDFWYDDCRLSTLHEHIGNHYPEKHWPEGKTEESRMILCRQDEVYTKEKYGFNSAKWENRMYCGAWNVDSNGGYYIEHRLGASEYNIHPRVVHAYKTARSARFEHGETP